jgi:hypothetical protein
MVPGRAAPLAPGHRRVPPEDLQAVRRGAVDTVIWWIIGTPVLWWRQLMCASGLHYVRDFGYWGFDDHCSRCFERTD